MGNITNYWPEMGEAKPEAQIEIRNTIGGKSRLVTKLELPKLRGLTFLQTYRSEDLVPQAQHRVGSHVYEATKLAVRKLAETYTISREMLLD